MSDSTYDVIVFGATSFVGQILCQYLTDTYGVDGELKWAAAGRSETKLQQVKEDLGSKADKLALITADANDDASLEALCANTAVVISTVGPYALYGEPMIRACTSTGRTWWSRCTPSARPSRSRSSAPCTAASSRVPHGSTSAPCHASRSSLS